MCFSDICIWLWICRGYCCALYLHFSLALLFHLNMRFNFDMTRFSLRHPSLLQTCPHGAQSVWIKAALLSLTLVKPAVSARLVHWANRFVLVNQSLTALFGGRALGREVKSKDRDLFSECVHVYVVCMCEIMICIIYVRAGWGHKGMFFTWKALCVTFVWKALYK